ncbi:hypothetical protein QTP88_019429 [Uroleucon formosanum]
MNFSLNHLYLLVAFLLLWCFESTIEAKQIIQSGKENYIYTNQQKPSGIFSYFWRRHNRTTTLYPSTTTEQWDTTTAAHESTSYHLNSTTERWNATTAAPQSTSYYLKSTAAHESTSYHSNSTTEHWNATTAAPQSTRKPTHHHNFRRRTTSQYD